MRRSKKTPFIPHRPQQNLTDTTSLTAATSCSLVYALSSSHLYSWFVVRGSSSHAFLDLASHREESLFNIAGVLGGRLEEGNAKAISEFLEAEELVIVQGESLM